MKVSTTSTPKAILLAVYCLTQACIPHVDIAGAPCPCPEDFVCCTALATCIPASAHCPQVYPASSGLSCSNNQDCPVNEICQAWTVKDNKLTGPRQCRRACPESFACAQGESCKLILHDGQTIALAQLLRACVPQQPLPGCEQRDCSVCEASLIGRSYCDGSIVRGCFLALDPRCGVECELVSIQDCFEPNQCMSDATGAKCQDNHFGKPCIDFPCDVCPDQAGNGALHCDGNAVVSCLSLPYTLDPYCDRICKLTNNPCPEGTSCQEQELGGTCVSQ